MTISAVARANRFQDQPGVGLCVSTMPNELVVNEKIEAQETMARQTS